MPMSSFHFAFNFTCVPMNNLPYPAGWSAEQVQGQGVALGSMEGLLDFLPFPGVGMAEGSLAQYVPGSEMEMTGWHDMEFLMEGYGDQSRTNY